MDSRCETSRGTTHEILMADGANKGIPPSAGRRDVNRRPEITSRKTRNRFLHYMALSPRERAPLKRLEAPTDGSWPTRRSLPLLLRQDRTFGSFGYWLSYNAVHLTDRMWGRPLGGTRALVSPKATSGEFGRFPSS